MRKNWVQTHYSTLGWSQPYVHADQTQRKGRSAEHAAAPGTAQTEELVGQCDLEMQRFNLKDVQDVKLWRTNQTGPLISQSALKIQQVQRFFDSDFLRWEKEVLQKRGREKNGGWLTFKTCATSLFYTPECADNSICCRTCYCSINTHRPQSTKDTYLSGDRYMYSGKFKRHFERSCNISPV